MGKVLVVEDNGTVRDGIAQVAQGMGHEVETVSNGAQAMECTREARFDLVITDYRMQGMTGLEVLERMKEGRPDTDVILITAYGSTEMGVDAMKKGAADYLIKPFSPDALRIKIGMVFAFREAREESIRLGEENRYLREEIDVQYNFGEIVGRSPGMLDIFDRIKKVADSASSVLIYGESGTGKELVARAIHTHSSRSEGPFVKVNSGALVEGLLESELFGHEKGAFTGAIRRKKGKFELADRGSIFLDEIGDVSPAMQIKLLRVLQEREFERVGGEETITVDVRVIAATHRDLRERVRDEKLREDLYYRLNVIPIHLPPLRERPEDIPDLAQHFLKKKGMEMSRGIEGIEENAMNILVNYNWPGNVRELENVIERAVVLCDAERIGASDLPLMIDEPHTEESLALPKGRLPLNRMLEDLERQLIERALEEAKGVKTKTAEILGIKTSALYYKLEKYGML